jgi:hypothetical protein
MDITTLALRYSSLCEDLKQRMSASGKWTGLPALLDELDAVRRLYRSQVAAFLQVDLLQVNHSGVADHRHAPDAPHFRYHGALVL